MLLPATLETSAYRTRITGSEPTVIVRSESHVAVEGNGAAPEKKKRGMPWLVGAAAVAADAIGRFGPGTGAVLVPVPLEGRPGVVAVVEGRLRAVLRLDATDGLIHHIHAVVMLSGR